MASLTVDRITSVENLNHPKDYYFYFNEGYFVWNPTVDNDLFIRETLNNSFIPIHSEEDAIKLQRVLRGEVTVTNLDGDEVDRA